MRSNFARPEILFLSPMVLALVKALADLEWADILPQVDVKPLVGFIRRTFRHVQALLAFENNAIQKTLGAGGHGTPDGVVSLDHSCTPRRFLPGQAEMQLSPAGFSHSNLSL